MGDECGRELSPPCVMVNWDAMSCVESVYLGNWGDLYWLYDVPAFHNVRALHDVNTDESDINDKTGEHYPYICTQGRRDSLLRSLKRFCKYKERATVLVRVDRGASIFQTWALKKLFVH